MNILTIEHLEKYFCTGEERQVIFRDFNLTLQKDATLAVTGESGAGKSTLLNLIAGLDATQGGHIQCCDYEVTALDEQHLARYRNQYLGFVFQTHFLLNDFTTVENVMMPALVGNGTLAHCRDKAEILLHRVGLADKLRAYPQQLSGGESQRVAIARALMNDPTLILADEPTGSLDQRNADIVQELLMQLVTENKKTLILVTHDTTLAATCQQCLTLCKTVNQSL